MLKWTDRYNCHSARLAGDLTIHANWSAEREHPGFIAYACGVRIGLFPDLPSAKKAAIEGARKMLNDSLAILEGM